MYINTTANPYYSCYPNQTFGITGHSFLAEEDINYYVEIIKKSFQYAYKITIEEAAKKAMNFLKIGKLYCADDWSNKINDIFYLEQYLRNLYYNEKLYGIKPCETYNKEFVKCFKKYWYCKGIDITPILQAYEIIETCIDDGVDYMIIIDPLINPNDVPPNLVR